MDGPAMMMERARLATQLLSGAPHNEIRELLPDFFESLAMMDKLDLLEDHLTWNSFSFPATHWWAALKDYVAAERARQGGDKTLFEEFEHLADRMSNMEASERQARRSAIEPSAQELRQFLEDERARGAHNA